MIQNKPPGAVANCADQELLTIAQAAAVVDVPAEVVVALDEVVVAGRPLLVDAAADEVVAAAIHPQALESLTERGPI